MRPLIPSMRQLVVALAAGLVVGLAIPASDAQTADTLDWKRYYPLEVGNVWEYHDAEARDSQTRYTLVADTVANGQAYYHRQIDYALIHYPQAGADTARSTSFDYVRYAEGGVIAVASVEADTAAFDPCAEDGFERDLRLAFKTASPCPLPLPEADSAHVEGTYDVMWAPRAIGSASPSDAVEVAAVKHITVGTIFSTFVADIGPVSTGNLWGPRLHYARIGGIEYGAPSALVNSEATPHQPETVSVRVLRNPVGDLARFEIQTPPARSARWTVTDALGRIVRTATLDSASPTLTVPTHELATGVYRFTVSAQGAQATVPFTVAR